MPLRRLSAACRWLDVSGTTNCNGKEHQAGRECFEHGHLFQTMICRELIRREVAETKPLKAQVLVVELAGSREQPPNGPVFQGTGSICALAGPSSSPARRALSS